MQDDESFLVALLDTGQTCAMNGVLHQYLNCGGCPFMLPLLSEPHLCGAFCPAVPASATDDTGAERDLLHIRTDSCF
eukprot:5634931-Amphidinium_carterae.1